jgi:hypothetical protein
MLRLQSHEMEIGATTNRNLVLATAAVTISTAGSLLLNILLAAAVYTNTGSGTLTSLFISLKCIPALLVVLYKTDWEDGRNPRTTWLVLELLTAALTLPAVYFLDNINYYALFFILLIRGVADHCCRIVKNTSVKYIFPKGADGRLAPIVQAGYFSASAWAGIVAVLFGDQISLVAAAWLNIACCLLSALLIHFVRVLNDFQVSTRKHFTSPWVRVNKYASTLKIKKPLLFFALFTPLISVIFQGTYSVLTPIFPLRDLQLDIRAVGVAYIVSSTAIFAGSAAFAALNKRFDLCGREFAQARRWIAYLALFAAALYMATVLSDSYVICAAAFFAMVFVYQLAWMYGYGGIVVHTEKGSLSSVVSISFGIGYTVITACSLLTGIALDWLQDGVSLIVGGAMLVFLLLFAFLCVASNADRGDVVEHRATGTGD